MPSISKCRISSPLEAGPSVLDVKQLPPQLTSALDYVSSRLARKRLHLSLIVVRKEIQIPSFTSPQLPSPKRPASPAQSTTSSPAKSLFGSSTFTRSLSKHSSNSSLNSGSTLSDSSSSLSRTSSVNDHTPPPSSPSSSCASSTPTSPNPYGLTLMHASTLTAKAEKILRHTIAKAEKKFSIGSGWLSAEPLSTTSYTHTTNDLIRRSLTQNEILFSSEGLTLVNLDHVYTFKCHLHTYSRTLSPFDLTSAVDELRRLVLAQNGRRITKGYLMRAYEWLGVSLAALVDVNEGYKTAYGGPSRTGGIEVDNLERKSPSPLALNTTFCMSEVNQVRLSISASDAGSTSTDITSSGSEISTFYDESESALVQVGESAKGPDPNCGWGLREDRGPHRRGPRTPNGFEDITPVTKGEWCFLMVGDGWRPKMAAVETC